MKRHQILLTLAAATFLTAPATPQTTSPFTIRVEQPDAVSNIVDGGTVTFRAEAIGRPSPAALLTITYRGASDAVQISQVVQNGSLDFSLSNAPQAPFTVERGGSFTATVQYLPRTSQVTAGQLVFNYVEGTRAGALRVNLNGTAPEFAYTYTPPGGNTMQVGTGAVLSFPDTSVDATALATVTLVNRGTATGRVNAVSVTGEAFELRNLPLIPADIEAGKELKFNVAFVPKLSGAASGSVAITLPDTSVSFTLQAVGTKAQFAYEVVRGTDVTPVAPNQAIAFGDAALNETTSLVVRARNQGNSDGVISTISVSGEGYRLANVPFLPATVTPGSSIAFTVSFTPTRVEQFPGRLKVGLDEFGLTGSGAGALLQYSYSMAGTTAKVDSGGMVNFTPSTVGVPASAVFTVANTGSKPATINSISVASASVFTLTGVPPLPLTLDSGATAGFGLQFLPKAVGAATDTLRIDNASFTLSGSGSQPPALPSYKFDGPSGVQPARGQPAIGLSLASAYPLRITGRLTLRFASDVFADDPAVQFATGGRTVDFTFSPNSAQAVFSNNSNQIRLQTGTLAGSIILTPSFTAEGGTNLTPDNPPSHMLSVAREAPQVTSVVVTRTSAFALTLQVTGFSTARSVSQINLQFAPVSGESVSTTSLSLNVGAPFDAWYQGGQATPFGSQFTATIPLQFSGSVTNATAPVNTIQSVSVSLTNASGTSNAVTATVPGS